MKISFRTKSLIILFLIVVSLSPAYTQENPTTDLCSALAALTKESATKFAGISGNDLEPPVHFDYKRKESAFKITDASSCYIEDGAYLRWYAEFGFFNSLDGAKTKIRELESHFITCMPGLQFIEVSESSPYYYSYILKEPFDGGFRIYKGKLGIYRGGDNYIPFFSIPENADPVVFNAVSSEMSTSDFANALKRLLAESLTDFANVTGAKTSNPNNLFDMTYQTTLGLPGAIKFEIEELLTLMEGKKHKSYYAVNLDAADVDKNIEILTKDVAEALGKDYVWQYTKYGTGFTESSKAGIKSYENPVIEIKKENAPGDKVNIYICIQKERYIF